MTAPVMMPLGNKICFLNEKLPMGIAFEERAWRNHQQSLAKLASRGGLSWDEALAIIEDREWSEADVVPETEARVRAMLAASPIGSDRAGEA